MAVWPPELPQEQFLGLTDQDQDAVLRSPMDTGPSNTRNRFSAIERDVKCPIVLTNSQRQIFDNWFRNTIGNGAFEFDWEDPVTDVIVSFKLKRPNWNLISGGPVTDPEPLKERKWRATLELTIQP